MMDRKGLDNAKQNQKVTQGKKTTKNKSTIFGMYRKKMERSFSNV